MPSKSKTRLTKKLVDQLPPHSTVWDCEVRGFGVRRQITDRTYVLKCRIHGKQRFITIGTHGSPWTVETARAEARSRLANRYQRVDPKPGSAPISVRELCAKYLTDYAPKKKPRSVHSDVRLIENHILPLLGHRIVSELSRADLERFHQDVRMGKTAPRNPKLKQLEQKGGKVVTGGPGVANRCLTLASKVFNLAEDWGLRPQNSNPARRIKRYREAGRERFLTPTEIRRLGKALSDAEDDNRFAVAAIRLLLMTGARLGEIISLRWRWVDLQDGFLHLPDSKTNKKTIRLSVPALELLKGLPRVDGSEFVIAGQKKRNHLVNLQKPWKRICKAAEISDVRLHDLRHTFASISMANGISLALTGAMLGHRSTQTTERYAHLQKDAVWQASQQIGEMVDQLLADQQTQDTD